MSEPERSPLHCRASTRKGRPCSKLGHYTAEGQRYCRAHLPEGAVKDPIRCEGRLADDSQCVTTAEQLLEIGPRCHFHARQHLEGAQPQSHDRGLQNGDGPTLDLDLDGLGLDEEVALTIRQRLLGVAHDLFPAASSVLADALTAEKYETITCPHCQRKHRRTTKDMGVRLAALKLLLDRTSAAPTAAPEESLRVRYPGEIDYGALSTAELRQLAFGSAPED